MKKVKTNSVTKILRKSCAIAVTLTLLPHPWTSSAFAQQKNEWVGVGMQAMQQIGGALQGAMTQSQHIDLSPSMVRAVPAANLPAPLNRCMVPQAKIPMPRYCESNGNAGEFTSYPDLGMSPTYRAFSQTKEFATKQVEELDRLLNEGKNEAANGAFTGIQCLKDAKLKEATRRQGILNAIQARIDEIKQRNLAFKEQVKLVELQMNKIKGELHGSAAGSSRHIVDNVNPPIKNLPANCQAIIEAEMDSGTNTVGLLQLRDGALKPAAKSGGDFLANQAIYKDDLTRFVTNANAHIAKHGIESFKNTGLALFKGNPALRQRINESLKPFTARVSMEESKIREELKKVGYDAPALDKNFTSDFNTFKADSKEYFRKKFVSECVTSGRDGLTIDPEVILNSLRQEGTNNQGTTIINYRAALKNILASDSFIEDKIAQMEALDKTYGQGNITITMSTADSQTVTKPAYVYFQEAVATCSNEYNDDKTFSTQEAGRSEAVKIERAEAYLNDLKKLHDTFLADMSKEVTDDILNCNGRATEAGSCKLNGSTFTVSDSNFCFRTAETCATQVNKCFAAADSLVQTKTIELNKQADIYNGQVEALFKDQMRFLGEFKNAVMQEAGLLNALIPGADFVYPKDLFIAMPELTLDPATNTYLRGGDSNTIGRSLDALAAKMDSLKSALKTQGKLADDQINAYIAKQADNIKANKNAFKAVVRDCSDKIANAVRIVTDFNAAKSRAEQDARAAAGDFCRRFYDLSTNPAAGCGDIESTYETANKAIQFITPNARQYVNNYRNLCNATQSEREEGTEDEKEAPTAASEIAQACSNGGDWNSIATQYKQQYLDELKEKYVLSEKEFKAIDDFISARSDKYSTASALLEGEAKDLAKERGLATDLDRLKRFMTKDFQPKTTTPEDFARNSLGIDSKLPPSLPTSFTPPAESDSTRALLNSYNQLKDAFSGTNNTEERIEKYGAFVRAYKSTTDGAIKGQFVGAFPGGTEPTFDGEAELKKYKASKPARDAIAALGTPADGGNKTYNGCDEIAATVWRQAVSQCADSSEVGCVQDKADELFASGAPIRNKISQLNFRSIAQSEMLGEFSELGETRGMSCDALAQNRRGMGMSAIESLDRRILGEQYDEIMNQR